MWISSAATEVELALRCETRVRGRHCCERCSFLSRTIDGDAHTVPFFFLFFFISSLLATETPSHILISIVRHKIQITLQLRSIDMLYIYSLSRKLPQVFFSKICFRFVTIDCLEIYLWRKKIVRNNFSHRLYMFKTRMLTWSFVFFFCLV